MINIFLNYLSRNIQSSSHTDIDISKSNKILFPIFTRYGDTIIDIVVIKEFIRKYPKKEYIFVFPHQMRPYFEAMLPEHKLISLNKRNIIKLYRVSRLIKKIKPDLALNPWSHGNESCYLSSLSLKYFCYKDFYRSLDEKKMNHYEIVRRYFLLDSEEFQYKEQSISELKNIENVLICPESTDKNRSMSEVDIKHYISLFAEHQNIKITLASITKRNYGKDISYFAFHKNYHSSKSFIDLVNKQDIIISADSAPLHISLAFNKKVVPLFKITQPQNVLNRNSIIYNINL